MVEKFDNGLIGEEDSFVIASEKRRIALCKRRNPVKPWVVVVYITRKLPNKPDQEIVLSYSEYHTLDAARHDFEFRRPKMRDASAEEFDMPMQKGKRLIQEAMKEKLGG